MNPNINFNVDQVREHLWHRHNIKTGIVHEPVPSDLYWLGVYPKWTDEDGIDRWTVVAGPFDANNIANIGVFNYKRDTKDGDLQGVRSFSGTVREDEAARAIADYAEGMWEYPDAEDLEDPHRPFFTGEWLVVGGPGLDRTPRWEWCVEGTLVSRWSGGCNFLADQAAVEHITREQPIVANNDVWFQWHGDTLVMVHDDDPTANEPDVQLVEPTEGGEYEMGFGWTWYEVDPLRCDYVVPAFVAGEDERDVRPEPLLPAEPYGNPNVNSLQGMRCPACGQTDRFEVVAQVWAAVLDDGVDEYEDPEWKDDALARCPECSHQGTWGDFRQKVTMTAGQMIAELQKIPADTPLLGYGGKPEWYLNVDGVHFDPGNPDIAATIELRDDYDTRQW